MWQFVMEVVLSLVVFPHILKRLLPYGELDCSNNVVQNYSPKAGEKLSLQHSNCSLGSEDCPVACLFSRGVIWC